MRRVLLITALLALAGVASGSLWSRSYLATSLAIPGEGRVVDIPAGTSLSAVARKLAADGVLTYPLVFAAYGRLTGRAQQIKAGEYALAPGLTPRSLLEQMVAGRVLLHEFTLVEGWSVRDVLRAMQADPVLVKTLLTEEPIALARELGIGNASAEGAFFPDTYLFPRGTTDRDLLLRAHAAAQMRLAAAWSRRKPGIPLATPYELLIMASIVERETALARERPAIAGVFTRRLQLGMRLQTDPTVIYGLGAAFDGNLTRRDLETDSPFNSYTRAGLPPTPIALPGQGAIDAAAWPADGTALYFVATGDADGSHRFSDTLAEHDAAVRGYLAALSRRQAR